LQTIWVKLELFVNTRWALGDQIFWLRYQRKLGVGFAARYNTDKINSITQFGRREAIPSSYLPFRARIDEAGYKTYISE
jgi:hypothetical protein